MSIVELHITLEDVDPEVKRTILVPLDIHLDDLHLTLQAALGWTDSHLYMFLAGQTIWGVIDPDLDSEDLPADKSTLRNVVEDTGVRALDYIYDFGDSWEHRIKIGKVSKPVGDQLYPQLTMATGRCPPEDVGGVPGYDTFVDAINNPQHPEHEHLSDWYGQPFDPNNPEIDELKKSVRDVAKIIAE